MAKRKHTTQRSRINTTGERPGFSRRSMAPPSARRSSTMRWILGAVGVIAALAVLAYAFGWLGGRASPSPSPSSAPTGSPAPTFDSALVDPPSATPLASPPAEPSGDGTRAVIQFPDGPVTIELYNQSSPVAAQNFINLARAGYYDGILVHRIVPGFVIQAGDPTCRIEQPAVCTFGQGDPGYGIPDEPVVGTYKRGTVAMARSSLPNSQGSQFFIVLEDGTSLSAAGGYAIFGQVIEGMDVVDQIAALPNSGPPNNSAQVDYEMESVTITGP